MNPKEGVLVSMGGDRIGERKWRDKYLQTLSAEQQERLDEIKRSSSAKELPRSFSEPLYTSDLTALGYQLVVEKSPLASSDREAFEKLTSYTAADLESSLLDPDKKAQKIPLREAIGADITEPVTRLKISPLVENLKPGEWRYFERGETGFDLLMSTHYGERVPFLHTDYSDFFPPTNEIRQAGICLSTTEGLPSIKFVLDTPDTKA